MELLVSSKHHGLKNASKERKRSLSLRVTLLTIYFFKKVPSSFLAACLNKKYGIFFFQQVRHPPLFTLFTDSVVFNGTTATSLASLKVGNPSAPKLADNNIVENKNSQSDIIFGKSTWHIHDYKKLSKRITLNSSTFQGLKEDSKVKGQSILNNGIKHLKSSTVFRGKLFQFSSTFPEEQVSWFVYWFK